jgi:hypothetical protein
MSEWKPYKITFVKSSPDPLGGRLLHDIHHVVHVPSARRILEDGHLKASLIYDESKLRKTRIAVNWLSANMWANGSIYGNVQFTFPWSAQIKGRRFYWVEAMTGYKPHAYRILMTDRDLSNWKHVREYDPSSDRGPLRERNGHWYWSDQYTSEFMIEGDIGLEDCTDLNFIEHHNRICRLDGSCTDRASPTHRIAGQVIAFLLGHGIHCVDHVLKKPSGYEGRRPLEWAVDLGIDGIIRALGTKKERFGGAIRLADSRKAVVRGAMALYGAGQVKPARELIALLKNESVFETALVEAVNEHFGISGWTPD